MALKDYEAVIHRCFRCGYCRFTFDCSDVGFNCPIYHRFRFETSSPGGLMWLIHASMVKEEIEWNEHLSEMLYSCTMCGNCVEQCRFEFSEKLVDIFRAAKEDLVENGIVLPKVGRFFRNIETTGNPYRALPTDRARWAEGRDIPQFGGHEYLYYVGCVGSYDERGKEIAKALGDVLLAAGLSFGILGSQELCDGNEAKMLGENRIFGMLLEKNLGLFSDRKVSKVFTLSPHSYNAFKKYYPRDFEVLHYTQLLSALLKEGKLDVSKNINARVTYHDPCFLGRHNSEYEAPRQILKAVPGIELMEMGRNRENAFCCGGGGGNFQTDFYGGGEFSPARSRIREAHETGANILAVACPNMHGDVY